ncbi:MAG: hypothetical protein KDA28_03415, partial [Phycisphaerales bacterium]|nr:hypothetical protein [Phycisphaerales bacterium]
MKFLCIMMMAAALAAGQVERDAKGRRVIEGDPAPLAFKNVTVEELLPFISEATGKAVVPQQDIMSRRITVINDAPIPREEALDFIFIALVQNGVAIVEHENRITLRDISEVNRQDVPVIGPDQSVLNRRDLGTIAEKVFALSSSTAKTLSELLEDSVPDYATLTADEESNQITILGTIALLQRMEHLITALDRSSVAALRTETFTLRYADAEDIKTNIEELFSADAGNAQ